ASDGTAESEPFRAETRVGNRRPLLRGLTLQPLGVISPGESVTAVANARDPDGDPLEFEYRWRVNGQRVDEDGPSLTTVGLDRGASIQVRVTASDGEADSGWIDSPIVQVGNAAPLITSAPGTARAGVFRYTLEARDPEGDRNLRYRLVQGPEGMTVDPVLGEVVWRPRASQAGTHLVQVAVRDSDGASTVQEFEVDVAEVELPAGG
ncbi:MAG: putative Ig domain-containing protein, partial [Myxococcota bacterium]